MPPAGLWKRRASLEGNMSFEEVRDAVAEEYAKLWGQWFQPGRHTPAMLDVNTNLNDAFRPRANTIIIGLGEGFATDPTSLSRRPVTDRNCATWMVFLVHEIVHE